MREKHVLDPTLQGPKWHCTECGKPSCEYTDHTLCYYCATGEEQWQQAIQDEEYERETRTSQCDAIKRSVY